MLWVICYDIAKDRARLRASQAVLRYGERVQHSVFECHLSQRELQALQRELGSIIDPSCDRVGFYPQCRRDRTTIRIDGHGPEVTLDERFRVV